jgi:hypothetical protein
MFLQHGRIPRGVINLMFRLLHPYYATISFISWSLTQFKRTLSSFFYIFTFLHILFHWKGEKSNSGVNNKKTHTGTSTTSLEKENQHIIRKKTVTNISYSSSTSSSSSSKQNTNSDSSQDPIGIDSQHKSYPSWKRLLLNWILFKFRR